MWESFQTIGTHIWDSIDDVFIAVGLLLVTTILSTHIYFFLNDYLILGHFPAQLSQVGLFFAVVVLIVQHLFGTMTASSIFGGFSIGFGYALQPYIIALFNGIVLRGVQGINNNVELDIPGVLAKKRKVKYVGMFHTCLEYENGQYFVSNNIFQQSPFIIYNN